MEKTVIKSVCFDCGTIYSDECPFCKRECNWQEQQRHSNFVSGEFELELVNLIITDNDNN